MTISTDACAAARLLPSRHDARSQMVALLVLASTLGLPGCVGLIYDDLQAKSKAECNRIIDRVEAQRCSAARSMSKEQYDAERAKARGQS